MQLFTHLLSSYLQGMGDFFSALPRGRSATQPPQTQQEGTPAPWGGHGEGLTQAAATLTELRFPSPGLRAKHATLGKRPTNLATLQELRLAEGVILNLMISTNPFLPIILLRVTPSANRNTYSVATPYYIYTQGRGAARLNPGL